MNSNLAFTSLPLPGACHCPHLFKAPITGSSECLPELPRKRQSYSRRQGRHSYQPRARPWVGRQKLFTSAEGAIHRDALLVRVLCLFVPFCGFSLLPTPLPLWFIVLALVA